MREGDAGGELVHQFGEVGTGEFPLEGSCQALVVILESEETILHFEEGREVVGGEDLPLDDREVDFDLVEPTGVDRRMDQDEVGVGFLEPSEGSLPAMGGAVIHDPEHPARIAVRGLGHDLGDEAAERLNAGGRLASSADLGAVNIERRQVGPRSTADIFMFDSGGLMRARRRSRMDSDSGLDAGFLVGADDEVLRAKGLALPLLGVEVENPARLGREFGIAGEDPGAVAPRANGVFMKPAPHGFITDGGDEAGALDVPDDVRGAQARERQAQRGGEFTGDGLDLHHDFWGEKPGADPGAAVPPSPAIVHGKNVCARG